MRVLHVKERLRLMSATATMRWRCWAGWIGGVCRGCASAVDGGDRGGFLAWAAEQVKLRLEVVQRADGGRHRRWLPAGAEPPTVPRFAVVPRRWVGERTFAWLG